MRDSHQKYTMMSLRCSIYMQSILSCCDATYRAYRYISSFYNVIHFIYTMKIKQQKNYSYNKCTYEMSTCGLICVCVCDPPHRGPWGCKKKVNEKKQRKNQNKIETKLLWTWSAVWIFTARALWIISKFSHMTQ